MKLNILLAVQLCLTTLAVHADVQDEGKEIFLNRCGMCHEYPEPSKLNEKQWKAVLKKMQKRMKFLGMVPLTDEENEKVFGYLRSQAKTKK